MRHLLIHVIYKYEIAIQTVIIYFPYTFYDIKHENILKIYIKDR